jgi:hypothetical protein
MLAATRFFLLCAAVLAFPAIAAAQATSLEFKGESTEGWKPTSLIVRQGQVLSFSIVGAWTVDHRYFSSVGPEGYSPQEDSQIFQGCKLNPALPYGRLLVKAGDDPSFVVIGTREGVFMPNRDGPLAFRIHDGDGCLGDNSGALTVTVTGAGISAEAPPFFYCITGPGGGCKGLYENSVLPATRKMSPAEQAVFNALTSPNGIECIISSGALTAKVLLVWAAFFNPALLPVVVPIVVEPTLIDYQPIFDKFNEPPELSKTKGPTEDLMWWVVYTEIIAGDR